MASGPWTKSQASVTREAACRVTVLAATLVAGCSYLPSIFTDTSSRDTAAPMAGASDASGLAIYLETMRGLIEGDAVQQAEIFQAANQALEWAPTTTNRLRHALALATPGHPRADAAEAARLLTELLASSDALLPEERMLATIHLKDVERRLLLNAEAERVKRDADTTLARQNEENSKRLQAALAENRRLKSELDDAQQKLEAITVIERSIRERDDGNDQ